MGTDKIRVASSAVGRRLCARSTEAMRSNSVESRGRAIRRSRADEPTVFQGERKIRLEGRESCAAAMWHRPSRKALRPGAAFVAQAPSVSRQQHPPMKLLAVNTHARKQIETRFATIGARIGWSAKASSLELTDSSERTREKWKARQCFASVSAGYARGEGSALA